MLDRTNFASSQQRIRLYCRGKENGVNILKSIDEGPFQMGTFRETLSKGTKGALHLGLERPRVYSDLTPEEKHMYNANIWATNIIFQGLPKDIYSLISHYTDAKDIRDNVKMLLKGSKLTKEDRQGNNARDAGATGYEGAHNRVRYVNPGQARQSKCYNYNVIGHIARNCTQPKRPQNSEYFKDKMLVMQAQDCVVALDEEKLLFITADYCDAFDSYVDEAPTVQTMFMANLSSAHLVYDKSNLSYESDILSEVHDHDHYQDAACEHHEEHEMHDDYVKDNAVPVVQNNVSSVPNDAYMIILNDRHEQPGQYVPGTTLNTIVDKSLTAELAIYKE
nr:integrase, catalytic region, zinc finger, CCHC-type, peptidase aspartic, catalytic [Tanacetum cinerariifolium]